MLKTNKGKTGSGKRKKEKGKQNERGLIVFAEVFTSLAGSLENYSEPHRNILWATDDQLVDEDFVSFRALEEQIPSF